MILHEPVTTRVGMPMDEFIRQFDEQPFELINGERRQLIPHVAGQSEVYMFFLRRLTMGEFSPPIHAFVQAPYVLADDTTWVTGVRAPDVIVYSADRLEAYKTQHATWRDLPFLLVPDLVIEAISPTDTMQDITNAVEAYLKDGVRLVWVVDLWTQIVTVRELGSQQATILYPHDTLTGGAVVPGFSVKVSDIFGED